MGLEYVDIFYSHRPDPNTPVEETMSALDHAIRSGKALYAGISNYNPEQTARAAATLRELGTPCLIHQPKYSMFERTPEKTGLFEVLTKEGIGCIAFTPLAQGLLTNRYLQGIPNDSRAAKSYGFLKPEDIDQHRLGQVRALDDLAQKRGQSLAQMALAWVLRQPCMTSALIGASRVEQIEQNVAALSKLEFSSEELASIETLSAS
jgi:L-glyceraldehyde 3-phosphate reductase